MDASKNNVWLHRFAWALAVATLFLVALGGVVTTKGVGMAVPDWPTTYGHHMFFFPFSQWYAGIFDEHSHRVWASIVGILAAVFAIWCWARDTSGRARWIGIALMIVGLGLVGAHKPTMFVIVAFACLGFLVWSIRKAIRDDNRLRWLAAIMFAAVIIQGTLGGLRVVLDVHGWGTEFGIFHGILAQLFFGLVCALVLITSQWWKRANSSELTFEAASRTRSMLLVATALVFGQLLLGATMRHQHQGLAVPDFPLAYGKLWPSTDPSSVELYNARRLEAAGEHPITSVHIVVHMLHRFTGVAVLMAIVASAVVIWRTTQRDSLLRRFAAAWCVVAIVQVTLGILTILSQRKVDVTTAHVALGAITFALGSLMVLVTRRMAVAKAVVRATAATEARAGEWKPA
jgi:cytochrome c oxidase assembly protein subunit 15